MLEQKPVLAHIKNDENKEGCIKMQIFGEMPSDLVVYISERSFSKYATVENATWTFRKQKIFTIYPKE